MDGKISAQWPDRPTLREQYHYQLGVFHGVWSTCEVMVDYAIGDLLKVPDQETHMITGGMMFGAKARLLSALLKRSSHPKKAQIQTALNFLRSAKRDIIVHGYQLDDGGATIGFVERPRGGDFKSKEHVFRLEEFVLHIDGVIKAVNDLQVALAFPDGRIQEFVEAARSLDIKA